MTEKTIGFLQRQRYDVLAHMERISQAIEAQKADLSKVSVMAEDMTEAIESLGGDASPTACKEASEAEMRRIRAAQPSPVMGHIGGIAEQGPLTLAGY